MKSNKNVKKLSLSKQTIVSLSAEALETAKGGAAPANSEFDNCVQDSYEYTCHPSSTTWF